MKLNTICCMSEEIYDYVVIGAGTAGSVVAGRLSESGKFSVCVLEKF